MIIKIGHAIVVVGHDECRIIGHRQRSEIGCLQMAFGQLIADEMTQQDVVAQFAVVIKGISDILRDGNDEICRSSGEKRVVIRFAICFDVI